MNVSLHKILVLHPLLIKVGWSDPCKLTLRKHKRDRNGKGMLRSCPPTLPCLWNNFASLWQLLTTCLHGATLWASPPHSPMEPPSEHPQTMSPWSHTLSRVKLSLTEDSPESVLDLMKSENSAGLSAGNHVLLKHWRTQACWAPAHASSDLERHWPPAEHVQGQPGPLTHIVMQRREEGDESPPNLLMQMEEDGLQIKGPVLEASGWLETNTVTYLSLSVSKLWNWGDGSNCYLRGPGGNQGQSLSENRDYQCRTTLPQLPVIKTIITANAKLDSQKDKKSAA